MAVLHVKSPNGTQKDVDIDKIVLTDTTQTITGTKTFNNINLTSASTYGTPIIKSDSMKAIIIRTGDSTYDGCSLLLGAPNGADAGKFQLWVAKDGGLDGELYKLVGDKFGNLIWDNKRIACDVKSGSTDGTISVNGTDVAVHGLASGAYAAAYTHPTTAGNKHIPAGGSSEQILVYSAAGTAEWGSRDIVSAGTGYICFRNGFILQRGSVYITNGSTAFTFPIEFSTDSWTIGICGTSANVYSISASSRTKTGATMRCGDSANGHSAYYVAFGK